MQEINLMSKFIQTISTVALLMMIAGQPLWAANTKGAQSFDNFSATIEDLLKQAEAGGKGP